MKIEIKIDGKSIELQQENLDNSKSVSLYDTKIPQGEDLISEKYNIVPCIFYYTNYLSFKADYKEGGFDCVSFFDHVFGQNIKFGNGEVCLSENLTNMYEVQSFYNRFDLYHITWEIIEQNKKPLPLCDLTQKQRIIEYLTYNCFFKIYVGVRVNVYPFTDLSNKLSINTGSFTRIERKENFIIKLKKTGNQPSLDLLKLLPDTILKIYLHGNYWLEKRN